MYDEELTKAYEKTMSLRFDYYIMSLKKIEDIEMSICMSSYDMILGMYCIIN